MNNMFFFAKADLVRDLRPLTLPCCSNDYGGAKSGEKRISLRKGEIWRQQSVTVQNSVLVNRNLCTCIVLQRSNWQVTRLLDSVPGASRTDASHRVRSHRVSFKTSLITPKSVISWKGVYKPLLHRWALREWLGFDDQSWGLVVHHH